MKSFVHLHNHTEYSLLDGAAGLDALVKAAKDDGQPALAITDHGNLYGTIAFYKACQKFDVKPILGLEAYFVEDRSSRPARRGHVDDGGGEGEGGRKAFNHLTILVENLTGYHNLRYLSSRAFLEGYHQKPRVDWDLLSQYHDGLIVTSGCLGSPVLESLKLGLYDEALARAARLQDIFGRDNFFIEMQDHGIPEQMQTNPDLLRIGKALNAPLLATNDLHYVSHGDAVTHDALLCVQTGSRLDTPGRFRFSSDQHYMKSAEEMRTLFAHIPEACDNTLWVAERANVDIPFDNDALPEFPIPETYQQATHTERSQAYLRDLAYDGARARYGHDIPTAVRERLEMELRVIEGMEFADYFLVVWDIIRYARESGIRVGPGRGSAAGCCVAYCLRIVDVDPLEYGLLFERFLNPARKQMPDIDMDFDERFRGDVIKYVSDKYGADHVAQIITFSTIKSRAAVRDAARVLGYPPMLGDKIAKAMPPLKQGKDVPLPACFEVDPEFADRFAEAAELRELYKTDPEVKKVVDVARGLTDKRRGDGIHAAAVVITKDPVLDYVPVQRKGNPDEAPIVTQFEMGAIESLGLLKMDFLGLRNLAIMERALDNIERRTGTRPDIDNVPLDDPAVFELLRRGDSIGVFQLEGDGMRSTMKRLAPTTFSDIGALVALYRPGPMGMKAHNAYADRKNGRAPVSFEHPDLEAILGETYGLMIYQEDVMRVATVIAGYSMSDADDLRKACAKKNQELLLKHREKFVGGAQEAGYGAELGTRLYEQILPFAEYAFNKSHAIVYAAIAYQNAWLKAHYPTEYMAALLTSFRDDKDRAALYLNEARQMGIRIDVPDVNTSLADHTPDPSGEKRIIYGLAAVRNVGEAVVDKIVSEREAKGPFSSIYDFVQRVDPLALNRRVTEALIKGGAFDSFGHPRLALALIFDELVDKTSARRRELDQGILTLFAAASTSNSGDDWEGTTVPVGTQEYDRNVKLNFEREMLGTFLSDHPLSKLAGYLASRVDSTIATLRDRASDEGAGFVSGGRVTIGGIITDVQVRVTKGDGRQYAIVTVEDLEGSSDVYVGTKIFERYAGVLVRDNIVLVACRHDIRDEELRLSAVTVDVVSRDVSDEELVLQLPEDQFTAPNIARLREVLSRHPGPTSVLLIASPSKTYRLGPGFLVSVERVIPDLRMEFGRSIIKPVGPREDVGASL